MFKIPDDEVVLGQGIHGEDGYEKKKLSNASDTVAHLIDRIEKALDFDPSSMEGLVVLANNFGGLTQLELQIVVKEINVQLQNKGLSILRVYSGCLMTSLSSVGVHLTILRLPKTEASSLIVEALDKPTKAPGWTGCEYSQPSSSAGKMKADRPTQAAATEELAGPTLNDKQQGLLKRCLVEACEVIIRHEKTINDLDSACGDADCGSTHKSLADGILASLENLTLSRPASLLSELAAIAENRMGGTSGAIYSLLLTGAAQRIAKAELGELNWLKIWLDAWQAGVDGIKRYSRARIGDKTLIDVIEPCLIELLSKNFSVYGEVLDLVIECVQLCAEMTKALEPRAGRASYVTDPEHKGKVDAGAYAVAQWMKAVAQTLKKDLHLS